MGIRTQVGTIDCLCCSHEIPVKQSEGGALSVNCPWCDFSGYAREKTQAFGMLRDRMQSSAPAPEPEAKKPAPKPAPVPEPTEKPKAKGAWPL